MSNKTKKTKYMMIYWIVEIGIYVLNIITFSFYPLVIFGMVFCCAAVLGLIMNTSCFVGRTGYNNLYLRSVNIGRFTDFSVRRHGRNLMGEIP